MAARDRAIPYKPKPSSILAAGGWMVLACMGFALMIGIIRHVAETGMHPFEIGFFRAFFGLIAALPWIMQMGFGALKTQKHGYYFARSLSGFVSMLAWIYGLTIMPLAAATALGFTMPMFMTVLAALVLGEVVRLRRWTAVAVGFLGTLVILQPGSTDFPLFGAGLILFSAATQAISAIWIKALTRTEPANVIVAYMAIYLTPLALIPALFVWQWPTLEQYAWLAGLGLVGTLAHLCYTRALGGADASILAPFDFTRLIFVAIMAYFAFGQMPDVWTWIGGAIILGAGVYIAHRESVAAREGRGKAPTGPTPPD